MATARGRELLTPDQRLEMMQIPEDDWALGTYYTFSNQDLKIINKRRREENRLGFAIQLAVLRFPGWSFTHTKTIPEKVVNYIAGQLEANPDAFSQYPQRENTLWDHLKDIRTEFRFVNFTMSEYRSTYKHLLQLALENGDPKHLLQECLEFLRNQQIILPALTTIERMVWEARAIAEKKLFTSISGSLTLEQKEKLE